MTTGTVGLGVQNALLTIHGRRLGISPPDSNNNAALLLDGYNVGGFSGIPYAPTSSGLTALAGGGQSSNTPVLGSAINILTVVATASDSVMLPPTTGIPAGKALEVTVINGSSIAAAVFPSSGDTIAAGGANVSVAMASSAYALFTATSSGHWYQK